MPLKKLRSVNKRNKKRPVKKKYDDEKMHFIRATALILIAVLFILSAVTSVYTFAKTKDIVEHPDIYRKQRDYECSEETDDRELNAVGTKRVVNYEPEILEKSKSQWSDEINPNPYFQNSNANEPELPANYRNASVGSAAASFLHDKVSNTLHTFANIAGDQEGQAGWYMDYFDVELGSAYIFDTTYIIDKARAVIVAEEVDNAGGRKYTDIGYLDAVSDKTDKTIVFLPSASTVQMRFFTQLITLGSMNIYKESVHSVGSIGLDQPLITVSFDDGWADVYKNAKPILDELNIKTSQNIISESFRSLLAGYMNLNEVAHLAKEGHEIASHSLRHCNLARLSDSDLDYDIKASKITLESEFSDIRGLAYPYGSYDDRVEQLASKTYSYVRTTETGYDSILMNHNRLRGITITPAISFDNFKEIIDFAVEHKLWVNLIYHKVGSATDEYAISIDTLRQQLEYVKSRTDAQIVTAAQAVDSIAKQQNEHFDVNQMLR